MSPNRCWIDDNATMYNFTDVTAKTKQALLTKLTEQIKKTGVGYAGFDTKELLRMQLATTFDENTNSVSERDPIDTALLTSTVESVLTVTEEILPAAHTHVFIFPSHSTFIREKMNGVGGFSPRANTIHLYVDTSAEDWQTALTHTLCHEYHHSVVYEHHTWQTLLDSIIFEGLAEHFRMDVVGGEISPWANAVNKKVCKKYFVQLQGKRNSKDPSDEFVVFFADDDYPLWLGYAIGYHIIADFLTAHPDLSWTDIMDWSPKQMTTAVNW